MPVRELLAATLPTIEVFDLWGNPDPALNTPVRANEVLRGGEHSARAVARLLAKARPDQGGRLVIDLTLDEARSLLARLDREAEPDHHLLVGAYQ